MKCGGGQRVLIGAAVELLAHQLFGSGVEHRADRHVRRSEVAGVVDPSSNTEVAKQNSLFTRFGVGHHDVGGLDVTMQETALMRVVEGLADGRDDVEDVLLRHTVRVALAQQFGGVRPVHVVHRDPDLATHVTAVVDTDDVRMPQRRDDVGFTVEPLPVLIVGAHVARQHLEGILPGQTWMVGQIDLAHASGAKKPHNGVTREGLTCGQRHGRIVQTGYRSRMRCSSLAEREIQTSIMPPARSGSVSNVSRWSTAPATTRVRHVPQKPCWHE